jgi:hypothetical protein
MSNTDLLPSLLFKINQNQLALEAAIMELTLWVEQRGSAEVARQCSRCFGHNQQERRVHQHDVSGAHDACVSSFRAYRLAGAIGPKDRTPR